MRCQLCLGGASSAVDPFASRQRRARPGNECFGGLTARWASDVSGRSGELPRTPWPTWAQRALARPRAGALGGGGLRIGFATVRLARYGDQLVWATGERPAPRQWSLRTRRESWGFFVVHAEEEGKVGAGGQAHPGERRRGGAHPGGAGLLLRERSERVKEVVLIPRPKADASADECGVMRRLGEVEGRNESRLRCVNGVRRSVEVAREGGV